MNYEKFISKASKALNIHKSDFELFLFSNSGNLMLETILDFNKNSHEKEDFVLDLLEEHVINNCKDLYKKWKKNEIT